MRLDAKRVAGSLRHLRHPLRILAFSMAAVSVVWGVTSSGGLVAAVVGAALGVVAGELLGRSRLRLVVVLAGLALLVVLAWQLGRFAVEAELVPELLGPAAALKAGMVVRYGAAAFAIVCALRTLASRVPALLAIELGVLAAAFTVAFAGHRDGVIARPLWLSDWAWQRGMDPSQIFLVVGGLAVVLLAILLIVESRARLTVASLLALPLLAALAVSVLNVTNLPKPHAENGLGLTEHEQGEPGTLDNQGNLNPWGGDVRDIGDWGGDVNIDQAEGQQFQPPPYPSDGQPFPNPNNPAPMAVVILGDDYSPPGQAFYFRQEAWSEFAGNRLVATTRPDADTDTLEQFPTRLTEVRGAPPDDERTLIHADAFLLVNHTHPFGLETPTQFEPLPNPNPNRFVRAYRFEALALDTDWDNLVDRAAGDPNWTPELFEYYTQPPQDPRFSELAHEIVAELPEERRADPFLQALAVKLYLDRNLTYYSRERHAGVPDPTADFLFGNRIGYCVHFAHAAVFLWRTLGIPARVGTGYYVEEDARQGSAIPIIAGSAHAWPELYLDGVGWVVLDIQAYRNLDPVGPGADPDLTQLLGEMARMQPPDPLELASTGGVRQPREKSHLPLYLLLTILGSLLALVVAAYLAKVWRRLAPRYVRPAALPRVAYRTALDILAEVGYSRKYGETREAFARRVAAGLPSFAELTRLHIAAKMRDPAVPAADRPELDADRWHQGLAQLRQEAQRAVEKTQRIVGLLNPLSILEAR